MVTVRARESFTYAGVPRARGKVFEARPRDAEILCLIGRTERVARVRDESPERTDDVDVTAGDEPAAVEGAAPRRRRTYRRKDIVAE